MLVLLPSFVVLPGFWGGLFQLIRLLVIYTVYDVLLWLVSDLNVKRELVLSLGIQYTI